MRCARYKFRMGHRRGVLACGNESGDMGDIDHHHRAAFLCGLRDTFEFNGARICAAANHNQLGFLLARQMRQFVIINDFRILSHSIWHDVIVLPGKI